MRTLGLLLSSMAVAVLLTTGCSKLRRDRLHIGNTAVVTLKGSSYTIQWVGPNSPLLSTWDWEHPSLRTTSLYGDHVNPLYNLQEDVPSQPPENDDWGGLWKQLASDLASKVEWFALVAYDQDKLAGMIRFFPKTMTRPRYGAWSSDDHQEEWTDQILWIGGAYVDLRGAEDGLDRELVRRVVQFAREEGHTKVQGLGWSDIRAYAMWGQSFPVSVYEALGFRRIATVDGSPLHALPDMLAGHHDSEVQKLVKADMEQRGFTRETANQFYMVELDCK